MPITKDTAAADENNFAGLSLKAWKAAPEAGAALQKDGFAGGVLKDIDDMVAFIREEGGTEDDVELAVKEVKDADGKGKMTTATISNESVDRHNDTISVKGWDLKSYKTNPVVLVNHASRSLPAGIATSTFKSKKEKALKQVILWNDKDLDPVGHQVGEFYAAGKMRAFSVGFRALEWEVNEERSGEGWWEVAVDFMKQELLENSAVTIPANSEALADAKSMGALPGFLKMAVEAIEAAGGWAFAPTEVKAAYLACKDLDDKRIVFDLAAEGEKTFTAFGAMEQREPADDVSTVSVVTAGAEDDTPTEPVEERAAEPAERDTKGIGDPDGGDSVADDEFEIDEEDAEVIGAAVAELVDEKLSELKEDLGKSFTAATGRLD